LPRPLFDRLFRAGHRLDSPWVQLIVAPAANPPGRIGYVIGAKQMPRAVDRNRLRRVLREAIRTRSAALAGLDIVIRLRRACARSEVERVASEALVLLDRLDHTSGR
jgi:ribonuclease P protein component